MAISLLFNRAKMSVSGTPGTGAITLGSAVAGFQTFAAAGVTDGTISSYVIEDSSNTWEIGQGHYTASGTVWHRDTVIASSNSGSAISATSACVVYLTALAGDVSPYTPPRASQFTWAPQQSGVTATDTSTGLHVTGPYTSGDYLSALEDSAGYPSTPFTAVAGLRPFIVTGPCQTGLYIGDGTKFITFCVANDTTNYRQTLFICKFNTSSNSFNGFYTTLDIETPCQFLSVTDDGTNLTFKAGNDLNAIDYQVYQVSRTDFLTPSQLGLLYDSGGYGVTFFHYAR